MNFLGVTDKAQNYMLLMITEEGDSLIQKPWKMFDYLIFLKILTLP